MNMVFGVDYDERALVGRRAPSFHMGTGKVVWSTGSCVKANLASEGASRWSGSWDLGFPLSWRAWFRQSVLFTLSVPCPVSVRLGWYVTKVRHTSAAPFAGRMTSTPSLSSSKEATE